MCMCMCGCGCVFLICCRWDTRGVSFSFPSYFHDHTAVVCLGWEHWQRKDVAEQEWSVTSSQNSTLSAKPVVLRVLGGGRENANLCDGDILVRGYVWGTCHFSHCGFPCMNIVWFPYCAYSSVLSCDCFSFFSSECVPPGQFCFLILTFPST